jgi:hypothetical protein
MSRSPIPQGCVAWLQQGPDRYELVQVISDCRESQYHFYSQVAQWLGEGKDTSFLCETADLRYAVTPDEGATMAEYAAELDDIISHQIEGVKTFMRTDLPTASEYFLAKARATIEQVAK